jgi:hypothetical protein
MKVNDASTQELVSHIMIPEVSDKGKAVALPSTIDLTKDITIDNSTFLLEGEEEALQHAITVSRMYTSTIIEPAASLVTT